jgi:hypothetical protein
MTTGHTRVCHSDRSVATRSASDPLGSTSRCGGLALAGRMIGRKSDLPVASPGRRAEVSRKRVLFPTACLGVDGSKAWCFVEIREILHVRRRDRERCGSEMTSLRPPTKQPMSQSYGVI